MSWLKKYLLYVGCLDQTALSIEDLEDSFENVESAKEYFELWADENAWTWAQVVDRETNVVIETINFNTTNVL